MSPSTPDPSLAFERIVYGRRPRDTSIAAVSDAVPPGLADPALGRAVAVDVVTTAPRLRFRVALALPAGANPETPAPCVLGLHFLDDAHAFGPARPDAPEPWPVADILARGWAVAVVRASDVVPDDPEAAGEVLARFDDDRAGGAADDPSATATIAALAWGLSCALTYLTERTDLDPDRIGFIGHSRLGKAALVAASRDERAAFLLCAGSGAGGAAPWRLPPDEGTPDADGRTRAETLESITAQFPHWFARALDDYRGRVDALPVEQSDLLALCAPRPVLLLNGADDAWAYPQGQLDLLHAAAPAWGPDAAVALPSRADERTGALLGGDRLGWFLRDGGHALTAEDWRAGLDFADRATAR